MYAEIYKDSNQTIVEFNRDLPHPIEKVWMIITDNDYLKKWFKELSVEELVKGGKIKFDMGDGTFEEMTITDLTVPNLIEFTWDKDLVRFELSENSNGETHMVFKEYVRNLTEHTPRDIAGWHICLDAISEILDGNDAPSDYKSRWEDLYKHYKMKLDH